MTLPKSLAGAPWLTGGPVARLFGYDVRSFVPPMMYNNCGNMGLPLAVLPLWQVEQVPLAMPLWLKVAGVQALLRWQTSHC